MNETTNSTTQAIENISALEKKISSLLGNNIWNYAQILNPALNSELKLQALTDTARQTLQDYITQVNNVLNAFEIDPLSVETDGSNITEQFELASLFVYKMRYKKALELFADYELVRVKTWLENKILKSANMDQHPDNDITYTVHVADSIITLPNGMIDREATIKSENETHRLKTVFSLLPYAPRAARSRLIYFYDVSARGGAYRVYNDQLQELITKMIGIFLEVPVQTIYSYLQRGYTPRQAQANTISYYGKILKDQKYQLAPALAELDQELSTFARTTLDTLEALEEESKNILIKELKEKIILDFANGALIPQVFYQLEFHKPRDFDEVIPGSGLQVDLFMYDDTRLVSDFPLESYSVNLTSEAKTQIFEFVTNGIVNPNYTLKDFLFLKQLEEND